MDALHAEEAIGHGTARVARGGYKNVDELGAFLSDEILQQTCHEAGTNVLEGEGGAVEEFQGVDRRGDLYNGTVERQGLIDQVLQTVGVDVLSEEGIGHGIGNVAELHGGHVVEESLRQVVDTLGHVKPTIFGKSLHHCLVQVSQGCLLVGAIVFHVQDAIVWPALND